MKKLTGLVTAAMLTLSILGQAQAADIKFQGIGGQIGIGSTWGSGSAVSFGAAADFGEIVPNLAFFPSVSYWSTTYYDDWTVSSLRINADVRYEFKVGGDLKPYAGGGLGLVRTSYGGPSWSYGSSGTGLQINLLGGVAKELTDTMTGFTEIRSDGGALNLTFGTTFRMGS